MFTITGGSWHKYRFVATKMILVAAPANASLLGIQRLAYETRGRLVSSVQNCVFSGLARCLEPGAQSSVRWRDLVFFVQILCVYALYGAGS